MLASSLFLPCAIALALPVAPAVPRAVLDSTRATPLDTGDLAIGPRDYSRYKTPWMCVMAARRTQRVLERDGVSPPDELWFGPQWKKPNPATDSALTAVTNVARSCGTFTLANATYATLPALFELALLQQNDALAAQVAQRWITETPPATVPADTALIVRLQRYYLKGYNQPRDTLISYIASRYLSARPVRYAAAESLTAQVARGGTPVIAGIQHPNLVYVGLLSQLLRTASQRLETSHMRRYAQQILTTAGRLPKDELVRASTHTGGPFGIQVAPVLQAYQQLAIAAIADDQLDSIPVIVNGARQMLSRLGKVTDSSGQTIVDYTTASADEWRNLVVPVAMGRYAGATDSLSNLKFWFPHRPTPGAMTLVVRSVAMQGTIHTSDDYAFHVLNIFDGGSPARGPIARIREWATRYQGRGLTIVLPFAVHGHALQSVPIPPEQEAERIRWYIQDYEKLPVTVAVSDAPLYPGNQLYLNAKNMTDTALKMRARATLDFDPEIDTARTTSWRQCNRDCDEMVWMTGHEMPFTEDEVRLVGPKGEILYSGDGGPFFDVVLDRVMKSVNNGDVK